MIRESTKIREAKALKDVLTAKPPSGFDSRSVQLNPDYVPPPLVDVQAIVESRRKPTPAEFNRDAEAKSHEATAEALKAEVATTHHLGKDTTAEATEASRAESVRSIRHSWNRAPAKQETRESADARNRKAHEENVDLIKAEMARSIHTESWGSD